VVTLGLEALDLLVISFTPCFAMWTESKPPLFRSDPSKNLAKSDRPTSHAWGTSKSKTRKDKLPSWRWTEGLICMKQLGERNVGASVLMSRDRRLVTSAAACAVKHGQN